VDVRRRGYLPKGGGEVRVSVFPGGKLKSASVLECGGVRRIGGISHCAGLPASIARGMEEGARQRLTRSGFGNDVVPVEIESRREKNDNTSGAGSGIVLWAELEGGGFVGGSALGKKGADANKVGEEAAERLLMELDAGGCVDEWLQDQIIIFMALAEGKSEVKCGKGELSLHTRTAIWIAEQLTEAKFDTVEDETGHMVIRCGGIGYSPASLAVPTSALSS